MKKVILILFIVLVNLSMVYGAQNYNVAIPYQFDSAGNFNEGLAPVEKDKKYGYIDKTGKLVIPYQFDVVFKFSEGLAGVKKNGKWGFIDKTGKLVIPYQFDEVIMSFDNGVTYVRQNDKAKYIDKTGKVLLEPIYYVENPIIRNNLICVNDLEKDKYGYIDITGKVVIPFEFEYAGNFNDGMAKVFKNDKYGYIDTTGKLVISYQFDDVYGFTEGLAAVKKDGKWKYIDKTGNIAIQNEFDDVLEFSEGLAPVRKDGKWGYIDKNGNLVVPYQFEQADYFRQDVARVIDEKNTLFINKKGEILVSLDDFYDYYYFSEGLLSMYNEDKKYGYISINNTENKINVVLNGEKVTFNQPPIIENNTTLVPMRDIFEKLGANVEWDSNNKKITATKDNVKIELTINSKKSFVNGKEYNLEVEPKILNETTLVPIRFIAESLNLNVKWNEAEKTINIDNI